MKNFVFFDLFLVGSGEITASNIDEAVQLVGQKLNRGSKPQLRQRETTSGISGAREYTDHRQIMFLIFER